VFAMLEFEQPYLNQLDGQLVQDNQELPKHFVAKDEAVNAIWLLKQL
jgi:hypothetical protein